MNMTYENPEWVTKLNEIIESAKEETNKKEPMKKHARIILTPRDEGLLWYELLKDLNSLKKYDNEIIKYPKVFEKICTRFSIKKQKAWECLFFLREFQFIEMIKCNGVKLNYKFENNLDI